MKNSVYSSNWENYPDKKIRRMLLIIITYTQKSLDFHIFGVYKMDLELFASVSYINFYYNIT